MSQSSRFAPVRIVADPRDIADRLTDFLRVRHPSKTAITVAAETGLKVATVNKWFDRKSNPSFLAMLTLVGVYGPAVLAACYPRPPAWLDEAAAAQEREAIEAEIARLRARL